MKLINYKCKRSLQRESSINVFLIYDKQTGDVALLQKILDHSEILGYKPIYSGKLILYL